MKLSKKYYACINSLCFFIHWENWNKSCNVFFLICPLLLAAVYNILKWVISDIVRKCWIFISIYNKNYQSEEIRWLNEIWVSRQGKGQIISKRFLAGRGFSQKTNENTLHTSKNELIRSFFGRILGLMICFRN